MLSVQTVLDELEETVKAIPYNQQEALADEICKSEHVFIAGAGRSGMIASCFAVRLMQAGFSAFRVGESVTPAIQEGDLLIIASGSGETVSMVSMGQKAKEIGAKVCAVTIFPESSVGKLSDLIIQIHACTTKSDVDTGVHSVQPMATLFEQSLMICMDYVVEILIEKRNLTEEEMYSLHANLE